MAFNGIGLETLISNADEQNALWRSLLQEITDKGGDTRHLNALVKDAKDDRRILGKLAKLIVGRIWKLAETPTDIGWTQPDFTCPLDEFLSKYKHVPIHRGLNAAEMDRFPWQGACFRYKLHHFERPMTFEGVLDAFKGNPKIQHANFRELIMYVSRLEGSDFSGCEIVAAGSRSKTGLLFPIAYGENNKPLVGWHGFKRPQDDMFGPSSFFLVRTWE